MWSYPMDNEHTLGSVRWLLLATLLLGLIGTASNYCSWSTLRVSAVLSLGLIRIALIVTA